MNLLRFLKDTEYKQLIELFHLARTALADKPFNEQSKYYRMLWACKEFHKMYPSISETGAYKDLSANLEGY